MTTSVEKAEFLLREGFIKERDGEVFLSPKSVALLTGVPESAVRFVGRNVQDGTVTIPPAFARDMRRGAAEVMAEVGSDDMFDVLYAKVRES